jgi:hypothetical protein
VIDPFTTVAADQLLVFTPIPKPVVKTTVATLDAAITELAPKYPDVAYDPEPI